MNGKKAKEIRRTARYINSIGVPIEQKLLEKNIKKHYKKYKKEGKV